MESGDIVEYNNNCYVVLRNEYNLIYVMAYDFTCQWLDIDECKKVGTSYAIFKTMYDIKSYELKLRKDNNG